MYAHFKYATGLMQPYDAPPEDHPLSPSSSRLLLGIWSSRARQARRTDRADQGPRLQQLLSVDVRVFTGGLRLCSGASLPPSVIRFLFQLKARRKVSAPNLSFFSHPL